MCEILGEERRQGRATAGRSRDRIHHTFLTVEQRNVLSGGMGGTGGKSDWSMIVTVYETAVADADSCQLSGL